MLGNERMVKSTNITYWHAEPVNTCLDKQQTTVHGLSAPEVKSRQVQYGENAIPYAKKNNYLQKWLNQFNNVLIYILVAAAIITAQLHHWIDAGFIIGVVLLNAIIGYLQESKAEKAIDALRKMLSPKAHVMRDGKRIRVYTRELVPGDIVFLSAGDKVPADLRLIKTHSLQIDESILTGESLPVEKQTTANKKNASLSQRDSMAYSGTLVTYGMGIGLVVATGCNTEIGRISSTLRGPRPLTTPLLRQLTKFGHTVAIIILIFSSLTFLFGIFIREYPITEMFMSAVAIAVAIIPEGLPAIITIALAIGVTRMSRRHAIIRRLASVETLSSVTVICTDKTGTLTKNELTVQKIITHQNTYDVSGSGYNDNGEITLGSNTLKHDNHPDLDLLIRAGILCNAAELSKTDDGWHLSGNPMDGALLALAYKAGLNYKNIAKQYSRIDAIPFDSRHKFMASLNLNDEDNSCIFVKGAPEIIISMCSQQQEGKNYSSLDKAYWISQTNQLAEQGMRVLAIAIRKTAKAQSKLHLGDINNDYTMLGLIAMLDPPREEAKEAVASCQQAGIWVKMVTGDHELTAQTIAKQVGIFCDKIMTGATIDGMSDEELAIQVSQVDVFARTEPKHKIRLIKALRAGQHVVAMTGDGVNDAPALKSADIGIAMGIKGTDVAKEASEIVLADDNFASIKYATEEARNVYNNLKKAILFILPSSGGEGFSVFLAILMGYTLPITPLQILWVNMITTVTLALALAFETPEKELMLTRPRNPKEPLLSKFLLWRISFVTLLYLCCMFGLFLYLTQQGFNTDLARTCVVNVLVFLEVVYLFNCRRIYDSALSKKVILGSKSALVAIGTVCILQLGFTYLPFMHDLFNTKPMDFSQWSLIFPLIIFIFLLVELEKYFFRCSIKLNY